MDCHRHNRCRCSGVANSWDPLNIYLLNLGSILWVWWAIRIKEPSIVVVNLAMLAVYVYGFFVRMI